MKGHQVGDGRYVILTPEELEQVEPGRTRTIDITDFVDAHEIDPVFFQTYYLAPQSDQAERAYALLRRAMQESGKTAIATFVMRSKQYLAAVRPEQDVLVLETMFFADEVRDPVDEIEQLPAEPELSSRDVDMAVQLIDSMATRWDPVNYRDTYRDRVLALIDAKRKGNEIVSEQPTAGSGDVVDLMAALRASIDAAKKDKHAPGNVTSVTPLHTREAASGDGGDDLSGKTKKELYGLAQQLDVPGRSSMDRDELEQAVRDAGASARKAS